MSSLGPKPANERADSDIKKKRRKRKKDDVKRRDVRVKLGRVGRRSTTATATATPPRVSLILTISEEKKKLFKAQKLDAIQTRT